MKPDKTISKIIAAGMAVLLSIAIMTGCSSDKSRSGENDRPKVLEHNSSGWS
jgi:hypothetical protein